MHAVHRNTVVDFEVMTKMPGLPLAPDCALTAPVRQFAASNRAGTAALVRRLFVRRLFVRRPADRLPA
jgi:hypothetical protein